MNGASGRADGVEGSGRAERTNRADSEHRAVGTGRTGPADSGGAGSATGTTDTIDVLVVDDDFMVARVHRAFVDRVEPFRVVGVVSTGEQAARAVDELHPDLVLLDLYLPDLFGLDVISRLRTAGHDCDVMVISAAREADAVRGAVRHGVVDYLLKPFEFEDLRARLDRYAVQRGRLLATVVHGQADVDRVLAGAATPTPGAGPLPKGMSVETAALVERTLRAAEDTLSAAECATLAGLSRVSARRYLEHFHSVGRAEVTLRYGAAGRPERRYRFRTHAGARRRQGGGSPV